MGQTTVRKGRGNSTVSKSIFFDVFFFYLHNYFRYTYIHIFFTIESAIFLNIFFGGDNPWMGGGTCPLRPPRDLRPCLVCLCLIVYLALIYVFIICSGVGVRCLNYNFLSFMVALA